MSSILTNNGAMVALRTLRHINNDLTDTQNQISTGRSIGSAKDNSALWAISQTMSSDVAGYEKIEEGLAVGEATVAVASAGAEQIVEKLTEIKQLIVSGQSENVDHAKIQTDIASKVEQINTIISAAQFNGANLLTSTIDGTSTQLGVLGSLTRIGAGGTVTAVEITVKSVNFSSNVNLTSLTTITDATTATTALGQIETFLENAIDGAAALGASASRLSDQSEFVSKLTDAMKLGISTMVDTDMEEASARLAALQTQQELAVQSLTIANEAPSTLMRLFR